MSCQWFCISMTTRKGATDWTYWPYVAWILLIICHLFQHMTCRVRHGEKGITRCVKCSFNFLMCSKYCLCWPFCETNVCGLLPSPSLQLHRRAWMPINLPANPSPSHPIFTNFFSSHFQLSLHLPSYCVFHHFVSGEAGSCSSCHPVSCLVMSSCSEIFLNSSSILSHV